MSGLAATLAVYAKLREAADLPRLGHVALKREATCFKGDGSDAYDLVRTAMVAKKGSGWVRFRSARGFWSDGVATLFPGPADHGPPLRAEWRTGPRRSCRLWFDGGDGVPGNWRWHLVTLTERPTNGILDTGKETEALAETVRVLGWNGVESLSYRLYWEAPKDDPSGLRRSGSRFAGLIPSKER